MSKSPELKLSNRESLHREALSEIVELLDLKVVGEGKDFNTPVVIVEDNLGGEVHMGYVNGLDDKPCVTGAIKIEGVKLLGFWHGPWKYQIDI